MSKEQREFELVKSLFELRCGVLWRKESVGKDGRVIKEKVVKNIKNCTNGYCAVGVGNKTIKYHRIVFMLAYNRPIGKGLHIDHDNGNKLDNRVDNLKEVTNYENSHNRKEHRKGKLPGVYFCKKAKKWVAQIGIARKTVHIGLFDTQLQAYDAYVKKWCEVYDAA